MQIYLLLVQLNLCSTIASADFANNKMKICWEARYYTLVSMYVPGH